MDWWTWQMKVLAIGGSGFLGGNMIHFLVRCFCGEHPSVFQPRQPAARRSPPALRATKAIFSTPQAWLRCSKSEHASSRQRSRPPSIPVETPAAVGERRGDQKCARRGSRLTDRSTALPPEHGECPRPVAGVWTEESNPHTSRRPRPHSFSCVEDALAVAEGVRRPGRVVGKHPHRVLRFAKLAAQD